MSELIVLGFETKDKADEVKVSGAYAPLELGFNYFKRIYQFIELNEYDEDLYHF